MTERHRRRHAGFAGQDLPPILRGEQAEVEQLDVEAALALDHALGDLDQPEGLRHLAGTGLVAARGTVHQQDA